MFENKMITMKKIFLVSILTGLVMVSGCIGQQKYEASEVKNLMKMCYSIYHDWADGYIQNQKNATEWRLNASCMPEGDIQNIAYQRIYDVMNNNITEELMRCFYQGDVSHKIIKTAEDGSLEITEEGKPVWLEFDSLNQTQKEEVKTKMAKEAASILIIQDLKDKISDISTFYNVSELELSDEEFLNDIFMNPEKHFDYTTNIYKQTIATSMILAMGGLATIKMMSAPDLNLSLLYAEAYEIYNSNISLPKFESKRIGVRTAIISSMLEGCELAFRICKQKLANSIQKQLPVEANINAICVKYVAEWFPANLSESLKSITIDVKPNFEWIRNFCVSKILEEKNLTQG
jgi:hypothetical protein